MADDKAAGNEHFKSGDYLKAAACYTKAIKSDPANHVLYSNRAQAFLKINKIARALEDADRCIELAPDFVKGYHRKAVALQALDRKKEAAGVAMRACEMDPGNRELLSLGKQLGGKEFAHRIAAIRKAAADATAPAAEAPPPAAPPAAPAKPAPPAAEPAAAKAGGGPAKSLANLSAEEFAIEMIRSSLSELVQAGTLQPKVFMQPSPPRFKTRKDKGSGGAGEEAALGVMQIAQVRLRPTADAESPPAASARVFPFLGAARAHALLALAPTPLARALHPLRRSTRPRRSRK